MKTTTRALLALTGALALIGLTALPAQAHTGDLKATAVCNAATGDYDVTYVLTLAANPSNATAVTSSHTGASQFQSGWSGTTWATWTARKSDVVTSTKTVTWTTTIPNNVGANGPWEYATTVWSDGYVVKSDTRAENLPGCTRTKPPVPAPKTRATPVSVVDCDAREVTTTTTPERSDPVWDAVTWTWTDGPWAADGTPVVTTRPATVQECPIPASPVDKVVTTDWQDAAWACGDTSTTQTRTVTTTPYVWSGRTWVPDTDHATSTTETRTRDLTSSEITACPVVVVPPNVEPTPTPTPTPHKTPTPTPTPTPTLSHPHTATPTPMLAQTGINAGIGALVALALLAIGAGAVIAARRTRKRN